MELRKAAAIAAAAAVCLLSWGCKDNEKNETDHKTTNKAATEASGEATDEKTYGDTAGAVSDGDTAVTASDGDTAGAVAEKGSAGNNDGSKPVTFRELTDDDFADISLKAAYIDQKLPYDTEIIDPVSFDFGDIGPVSSDLYSLWPLDGSEGEDEIWSMTDFHLHDGGLYVRIGLFTRVSNGAAMKEMGVYRYDLAKKNTEKIYSCSFDVADENWSSVAFSGKDMFFGIANSSGSVLKALDLDTKQVRTLMTDNDPEKRISVRNSIYGHVYANKLRPGEDEFDHMSVFSGSGGDDIYLIDDLTSEKKEDFDLERYIYDRKTDSFVKNDDYKASGINIATDYMKDIEYYNSGIYSAIKVIDESSLDRVIQRMIYNTDYFSFTTDNIIGDLIYYDDKSFIIWSGYQMNYYNTEKMEHCTLYTNDIGSHPIVMDGDIFVTNGGGGIFCIKPDTGAIYTLFDNGGEAVRGNGSYYDVMNMSCLYDSNDGEGFIYTCYDYSKSRDGYTMIYLLLHQ